jgi:hypothetical protein
MVATGGKKCPSVVSPVLTYSREKGHVVLNPHLLDRVELSHVVLVAS